MRSRAGFLSFAEISSQQPFAEKQFDAVTFWAVLEHLLEPKQFLEKAWSILKPDGLCFVLVPNMQIAGRAFAGRALSLHLPAAPELLHEPDAEAIGRGPLLGH